MRILLMFLAALNALVFFFGAVLHSGVVIGPFHQPHILPATIVEVLCGLALTWAAIELFKGWSSAGRVALTANLIASAGIFLGVLPGALRHRTWPSIALDHRVMLILIGVSLLILLLNRMKDPIAGTMGHRIWTL
jgi:hypothetical protein